MLIISVSISDALSNSGKIWAQRGEISEFHNNSFRNS